MEVQYHMNCYQRLAVTSYLSQIVCSGICPDLSYVIGMNPESGSTSITGVSDKTNIAIRTLEKNGFVSVELTDMDRYNTDYKTLEMYGNIRLQYNDTHKMYWVVKESAYLMDPAQVVADTFVAVSNAIFDNVFNNSKYTDFIGKEYGFVDAVVIKVIGMMNIEKLVYGVMKGKMTLLVFPKDEYVKQDELVTELTDNILVYQNLYNFIDSVRVVDL